MCLIWSVGYFSCGSLSLSLSIYIYMGGVCSGVGSRMDMKKTCV